MSIMDKNNIAITVLSALIIAAAALLGVTMSNGDEKAMPPEVAAYYSIEESVSVSSGPVADTTQAPAPEIVPEPAPEGRVFEETIHEAVKVR